MSDRELTDCADAVFSFVEGAANEPAVSDRPPRMDKVAGIRAKLAAGTYHIPAAEVAEKLLRKAEEMKLRSESRHRA